MALRKIASSCDDGDCPTLYQDDSTGDFVVQGYLTDQAPAGLPRGEGVLRIPAADLLRLVAQLAP